MKKILWNLAHIEILKAFSSATTGPIIAKHPGPHATVTHPLTRVTYQSYLTTCRWHMSLSDQDKKNDQALTTILKDLNKGAGRSRERAADRLEQGDESGARRHGSGQDYHVRAL